MDEPQQRLVDLAAPSHTQKRPAMANRGDNASPPPGRDHVVIFPFMAKGHTLPLLHFATALSLHHRTLRLTLLTTPANRAFARSHLPASVNLVELPFPSLPPLPAGVESTDALPSRSLYPTFLRATALLREPFAAFLSSLPSPPLALISDFFLGFTHRVARAAGVRRVEFNGMSCFSLATCKALIACQPPAASAEPGGAPFHVQGMPEHVVITAEDVPSEVWNLVSDPEDAVARFIVDELGGSDEASWGVLVNSFAAVDEAYAAALESFYHYQPGTRAWLVGPLFLAAAGDESSKSERDDDPEGCLSWLDQRSGQPGTVVYVSFGTEAHVSDEQLEEIALGLVQSGYPFLWAVRSPAWSPPVDLGPNGRIVRGWVPQRRVLAHKAVGGFVSHTGWNSVMESLSAGKPVLAWPLIAEQRLNARHVVDIVGAGVRVDAKAGFVERAEVEEKVRVLMDADGEVGKRVRARAAWVQEMARSAVSDGGTSRLALHNLVQELQTTYKGGDTEKAIECNGEATAT
ncbi:unnamed protein product [Urochloa decumbens]|uniref:Glycosyltransferase n=1 Tax=Urochloa decumbens TaxID=240449 RepID=A0ABC8YFV5_9POAL